MSETVMPKRVDDPRCRGRMVKCGTCQSDFWQRQSQAKQGYGNYCSKQCWAETNRRSQEFSCKVCNGTFSRAPWQIAKGYTLFCSRRCIDRWKRKTRKRGGMNLFTPWQKREWRADECARCGGTDDLQLDHIRPRFAGGTTARENAQTLCGRCNRHKHWNEDLVLHGQILEQRFTRKRNR